MKTGILILFFIALIFISGCVEEEREIKELVIPGHHTTYQFSHDIRESIEIPTNNFTGIRTSVFETEILNIVFDGSSAEDNGIFGVVLFNVASKLNVYFAYEGKIWRYNPFYYIGDQWYNGTEEIDKPVLGITLWLLGPNTGANETSVNLIDDVIYLQGTSSENMELAGDKFALIVMGVREVEQV